METKISVVSSWSDYEFIANLSRGDPDDVNNLLSTLSTLLDDNVTEIIIRKKTKEPTVQEYSRIVVETDEKEPKTVADITVDNIVTADGYRAQNMADCEKMNFSHCHLVHPWKKGR